MQEKMHRLGKNKQKDEEGPTGVGHILASRIVKK